MNQLPPRNRTVLLTAILCGLISLLQPEGLQAEPLGFLTIDDRVDCQRAIEAVYWKHRIWPASNPQPKPPLSALLSDAEIRVKVEDALRKSDALERIWQKPLTPEQLAAEVERMARETRNPALLRELWAALGNDPLLVAECLARPQLGDRLARAWYAFDERLQAPVIRKMKADLEGIASAQDMHWASGRYREEVWVRDAQAHPRTASGVNRVGTQEWAGLIEQLGDLFGVSIAPPYRDTGRLPVYEVSPLGEDADRYYLMTVLEREPDRLRLATLEWPKNSFEQWWAETSATLAPAAVTGRHEAGLPAITGTECEVDTWRPMRDVPDPRADHVAVWTGTEMVVWGNRDVFGAGEPGGRYDPALDVWHPISTLGQPEGNMVTTAVWTGTEMILWGGFNGNLGIVTPVDTGARYDPVSDSWRPTGAAGALPAPRGEHTAIWTGTEMIVWGGCADTTNCQSYLEDGGRYDPVSDAWLATDTSGAPEGRQFHTATWTGSEMVVWGGEGAGFFNTLDDGARYDPAADSWSPMSMEGGPEARVFHTAVSTGTEVLVWGGCVTRSCNTRIESGGGTRYDLASDTWSPMGTAGVPSGRYRHSALWTGEVMIVHGGCVHDECSFQTTTGGRYDPITDAWQSTNTDGAPYRASHTAVWTGSEMIVWGGCSGGECQSEWSGGARYDPMTDSWVATSTESGPVARINHSAVWTGVEMILWGGAGASNDGARYNPATDHWTEVNPFGGRGRDRHSAVWTGSEMLVWGGSQEGVGGSNTGERYDVLTDSWTAMSTAGAPRARQNQSTVWTGREMIVWGGCPGEVCLSPYINTGGRYDPASDSWKSMSTAGAPSGRISTGSATEGLAVWTGKEMIVWGGQPTGAGETNTGGRYSPATDSWVSTPLGGAPAARRHHTLVWSGSELLVWGGENSLGSLGDGARYDPGNELWAPMSDVNAPSPRFRHGSVWTGSELVVWGGNDAGVDVRTGGRYDPATDQWLPTDTGAFVPVERNLHTAVWTGSEMLVWGGQWRQTGQTDTGAGYCAPGAGPPTLIVSGSCQTPGSLEISGMTPFANFAIVRASGLAPPPFTIPGGSCAGLELGLDLSAAPVAVLQADGVGSFGRDVSSWPCVEPLFLQAVDVASCTLTNVATVEPQ